MQVLGRSGDPIQQTNKTNLSCLQTGQWLHRFAKSTDPSLRGDQQFINLKVSSPKALRPGFPLFAPQRQAWAGCSVAMKNKQGSAQLQQEPALIHTVSFTGRRFNSFNLSAMKTRTSSIGKYCGCLVKKSVSVRSERRRMKDTKDSPLPILKKNSLQRKTRTV